MTSLASKAMPILLRLRGTKKKYSTAQATRDEIAGLQLRPKNFSPPSKLDRTVDLSMREDGGWRVYKVTPKGSAPTRRALYLHGGAYIHDIIPGMWSLVAETAVATSTRITVPIYPLAPLGVAEMPTIRFPFRDVPPIEPKNGALPNANIPPSAAANQ